MRTIYFDCAMGAAGDMLSAALFELMPNREDALDLLNGLKLPGVTYVAEPVNKCGILGTHMSVQIDGEEETVLDSEDGHEHNHECHHEGHNHEEHNHDHHGESNQDHHHHDARTIHDIEHIVKEHLPVSEKVRDDILAVFGLLAEAESLVHGVPVPEIHFHEVGTMDAIADICAVCVLMDALNPEQVLCSPIHVGSGQVKCAHGVLPVPAPATAQLLKDVPIYGGSILGELCTPTGAALLKYFVNRFGTMPIIRTQAIGYGCGKKDFEAANCVRVLLGETNEQPQEVCELFCNVDDMTAEAMGYAMEQLMAAGALDVFTTPIGMKKSRPGQLLSVMCKAEDCDKMIELVFRHTTTIGIREQMSRRYTLNRRVEAVETPYGTVHKKCVDGYGVMREKFEYEDLARIAREKGLSLQEVTDMAVKCDIN